MSVLLTFVAIVLAFLGFDLAAVVWGADSRDGPDSVEWERRRHWKGYR
jgi:hypothetical protein